ncbi:MAG: alpha-L-fucosidase [Bacillota bacterium]
MQSLSTRMWVLAMVGVVAAAQVGRAQTSDEQRLKERLEWFQDQKFGLFMHWGIYSQLGCIESWPIVFEDRNWSNPGIRTYDEMVAFRKVYFLQNRTFNPTQFDPTQWAKLAKRAGMKYVMFTTKHHDGFCMFDTKLTDFKVTGADCPFSKSAKANIAKEVFAAFRAEGFGIGAYFSKSDWHHPGYWDPDRPAVDRNPNYDTAKEPKRWEEFVKFVHGQIEELMTGYGKIDILWLDGGQVRPPKQDVQMDRMAAMARKHQPQLIIVDRTAGTKHEEYRTPEQEVPDKPLPYAWESCLTMGEQWSFKPDDKYKSTRQLIHLLVDIVAKGGNFLLNVGPRPDGKLPMEAAQRLEEIGQWMDVNAEAIHGTRPIAPYKQGRVAFTSKGNIVYAIYLEEEGKEGLPQNVVVQGMKAAAGSDVKLLGVEKPMEWTAEGNGMVIRVPESVAGKLPCKHAFVFKMVVK